MNEQERFEAVCALVDGSIGYFAPAIAGRVVEDYERGETRNACERCLACFGGDLRRMVEADLRYWRVLREARKEGVRAFVRQVADLDGLEQSTAGLLYPTLAL